MEKLLIHGPVSLQGRIKISGAKNAVLPILAACLLVEGPVVLENIPYLRDVSTMIELLGYLGVECTLQDNNKIMLDASQVDKIEAPYELVKRMRASIVVLGPLLGRFGEARVSLPGGCAIGSRPVDLHIEAMQALDAQVEMQQGYIHAQAESKRLRGGHIKFSTVTVTGTENALMAAVLADGETVLENAAMEPEVTDLVLFLQQMGAQIAGVGTTTLTVTGVKKLQPQATNYKVMFDRIEAGTFLFAGAITSGDVTVENVTPESMLATLEVLRQTGGELTVTDSSIRLNMQGKLPQAVSVETAPYPGFATDLQAQLVAMNCIAVGQGQVIENVFENRFMHVQELRRLGAQVEQKDKQITTQGQSKLESAEVMATDLRASACLVLAGLVANGTTIINRIYHIDRGYERLEEKFNLLGAKIERIQA